MKVRKGRALHRKTVEPFSLTSSSSVGCFVGAVLTSIVGESLGRKRSIFLGGVVMLIGALLQGLLMVQLQSTSNTYNSNIIWSTADDYCTNVC